MKKHLLIIGIIFLFLISAFTPMTTGLDADTSEIDVDPLKDYYSCYNLEEIPESIRPVISEDEENQDIPITNNIINPQEPLISPPMDSPWPMYCYDVRHTSRSPYSTADNNFYNKWWYKSYDYIEGSGVIDSDGVIYFGGVDENYKRYLLAVYPNGTLKWKCLINSKLYTSPAIGEDGTIYVVSYGSDTAGLYAISPQGTIKWRYPVHLDPYSSPAIGLDGTIYFGDHEYYINAINPNGTLKWRYKTGLVVYSSPVIGDDGTVYCGSHDTYLYAFYPNNGTLKWKYNAGGWVRTSPCIGDDGTIYVSSFDYCIHAVYPNNGTRKWRTNVGGGTSPTIGRDGTIYAGYSTLYAVNPDGSVKWTFPVGGNMRGGTPCNSLDGTIFVGTSDGGKIIAINPDGTERWKTKIGKCEFAPIIGEDGTVYIGNSVMEETGPGEFILVGYLYAFNMMDSNAPSAPVIEGPTNGNSKKSYNYIFISESPLGNDVYYYIDWRDGDWRRDCWVGPYGSGEEAVISHTWSEPGTYNIRARCKDTENLWSDWSEKSVIIPRDKATNNMLLLRLLERFPLLEKILRFHFIQI